MKLVIVDYKLGNLFSVNQAFASLNRTCVISANPRDIATADAIILPGVGAFKDAMHNLNELELTPAIQAFVKTGKPMLGICLGLQLLFNSSAEFGETEGLNIIPGTVQKFSEKSPEQKIRVPQIGWNTLKEPTPKKWVSTPLQGLLEKDYFYFVHSYYVAPTFAEIILSFTEYGSKVYASTLQQQNVFACQFHPEKSAQKGLSIYQNWLTLNKL